MFPPSGGGFTLLKSERQKATRFNFFFRLINVYNRKIESRGCKCVQKAIDNGTHFHVICSSLLFLTQSARYKLISVWYGMFNLDACSLKYSITDGEIFIVTCFFSSFAYGFGLGFNLSISYSSYYLQNNYSIFTPYLSSLLPPLSNCLGGASFVSCTAVW